MPSLKNIYAWLLLITCFLSNNQYARHEKYKITSNSVAHNELEQIDANRLQSYNIAANKLSCLSDLQLAELLSTVSQWSKGCGSTGSIEIDGIPVFIKKIALTDLEKQPTNMHSTANLFNLPLFYQYRVGSNGFGVWRELAAEIIASNWALTNACKNFPILYHWRIMNHDSIDSSVTQEDIDKEVEYWDNSTAVKDRLQAINKASTSIVMFLESIPQTLDSWLVKKAAQGSREFEVAVKMVDQNLRETTSFMMQSGMIHFDTHSGNILTDGHRLYFADFGLALSSQFDLSLEEKAFFELHKKYDKVSSQGMFAIDILRALSFSYEDAVTQLKKYIEGDRTIICSPYITSILQNYAQSSILYDSFMSKLRKESKLTPYPAEKVEIIL